MNKILIAAILAVLSFNVMAGGGKVSNPWQSIDEDECAEWRIDEGKNCRPDPSDQSGSVFICEVLVICPDLEIDPK